MTTETTFRDLAKRLYDSRKAAKDARRAWQAVAQLHGRCEYLEDDGVLAACYHSNRERFCSACKAKQPHHQAYRAKVDAAAAALRAILRAAKAL